MLGMVSGDVFRLHESICKRKTSRPHSFEETFASTRDTTLGHSCWVPSWVAGWDPCAASPLTLLCIYEILQNDLLEIYLPSHHLKLDLYYSWSLPGPMLVWGRVCFSFFSTFRVEVFQFRYLATEGVFASFTTATLLQLHQAKAWVANPGFADATVLPVGCICSIFS